MAGKPLIQIEGMKELRRELRKLEDDGAWKKELRAAGYEVATVVADWARASAKTATNPRMGHRAIATIRPLASQTSGTVAAGKKSAPETMGHIWGSNKFRQFPPRKKGGYHLYPAIAEKADEIVERYGDALEKIMRKAYPD